MTINFSVFSHNPSYLNRSEQILIDLCADESVPDTIADELSEYINDIQKELLNNHDSRYLKTNSCLISFLVDNKYNKLQSPIYNVSSKDHQNCFSLEGLSEVIAHEDYESPETAISRSFVNGSHLAPVLYNTFAEKTHFLNPGLISFTKNYVVFECPPSYRLIQYYPVDRDNIGGEDAPEMRKVSVPVPWQVYVAVHNGHYEMIDSYMFFSRESVLNTGLEQKMYLPYLPNFYSNASLCRPFYDNYEDVSRYDKDLNGVMHACYDSVWNSGWNFDLVDCVNNFRLLFTKSDTVQRMNEILYNLLHRDPDRHAVFKSNYDSFLIRSSHRMAFSSMCEMLSALTIEEVLSIPMATPSYCIHMEIEEERFRHNVWDAFLESDYYDSDRSEDEEYMHECFEDFKASNNILSPREQTRTFEELIDVILRNGTDNLNRLLNYVEPSVLGKNYVQMVNYFTSFIK